MFVDYETAISKLIEILPFIKAVAIIEGRANVVYSTKNWDIKVGTDKFIYNWFTICDMGLKLRFSNFYKILLPKLETLRTFLRSLKF